MLSMRECEVQDLVRQERLRESEQQRLVDVVSRQNVSRLQNVLNLLRNRSSQRQLQVENRSLVS